MRSGIFGWSLPPGVTMNDIDPPERPCEVCGIEAGNCICPECPVCGEAGNPECYEAHGLVRTPEQIAGRKMYDEQRAKDVAADSKWEMAQVEEEEFRKLHPEL
jgi:hypothetical protein